MRIYHALPDPPLAQPSTITIGNFDGVHLGHLALVSAMLAAARQAGRQAGLLTFDPHPTTVLRPNAQTPYLTTVPERLKVIETVGLDYAVVYPFSRETAQMPARHFVESLWRTLNLAALWVGPDFALGRNRDGDVNALRAMGEDLGFEVCVIDPQTVGDAEVRSGRIRQHLLAGEVAEAERKLGRPYRITGQVERGAQRGRSIGFPTANLAVPEGRLLPANGVYATWVEILEDGEESSDRLPSVTNIGVRPSFDNGQRTVETHMLDFQGNLYGRNVALTFVRRLRAEMRFASVDALRAQIERDVSAARAILGD